MASPAVTDPRSELLAALHALAEDVPDMRVGQLVAALGELAADATGRGTWDADDAELLAAARRFRRDLETAGMLPARTG
jgi:hypothetical protein